MDPTPPQPSKLGRLFPPLSVGGLLVVEAVLFASAQYRWFEFNYHKGWTPLIALVVAFAWFLLLFAWVGLSRLARRPAQFGLRTVLALVLVAALPCAWFASAVRRAREQRNLGQLIEVGGGTVGYFDVRAGESVQFDRAMVTRSKGTSPWHPRWLVGLIGRDYFFDIGSVRLSKMDVLNELRTLPHLILLTTGPAAVDSDIEKLSRFPALELLHLSHAQISDDGVARLPAFPLLKAVHLNNTDISDAGLEHLSRSKTLKFVNVVKTNVTQQGVNRLKERLRDMEIVCDVRGRP